MAKYEKWLEQVYAGRTKEEVEVELQNPSNAKEVLKGLQEDSLTYLTWYTDYGDEGEVPEAHFLKATDEEIGEFAEWLFNAVAS